MRVFIKIKITIYTRIYNSSNSYIYAHL